MNSSKYRPLAWIAVLILLVSWACSLSGGSTPTPEPEEQSTREPLPTKVVPTEPQPSGAASSRTEVESAVIRIEAKGDFVYPEGDYGVIYDTVGSGTGFIIDPEGIAITNNHVVTGADSLKVYFSGNDEAFNAKVLGVSECSDLAVIDIEGDGYPYLAWYEGDIDVGMDVWSAGYPLGDPEYSLHKGIVSKRQASLNTDWAAVDSIIEHDATINPGNSGGPLINDQGEVVAINYATTSEAVNQFYAIAREEAEPIIEDMQGGKDITSIGVNGFAFVSEDGSLSGVWVYSVDTGSPAYKAGVRGGDILSEIEGSLMGTDGTKREYCEILRSHNSDDPLSVKVIRLSTSEILEGTLNGDKLEVVGAMDSGNNNGNNNNGGTVTGVQDDFAEDSGNFETFDGAQVVNGIFYLGEFNDCADVGTDSPFGCFSSCLTCGYASNYDMQVDAAYSDGVTERTFGMVLRFVDNNGNGLVDRDDYYLDFELSIYDQYATIWEHRTDGKWYQVADGFVGDINPGRRVNTLHAIATNGGADIDFYINDAYVTTVTDIPFSEGTVGLVMGGRAMQVAFDNFIFIPGE